MTWAEAAVFCIRRGMHYLDYDFIPPFCPNDQCVHFLIPPKRPEEVFEAVGTREREWFRCRNCRKKFRSVIFADAYRKAYWA